MENEKLEKLSKDFNEVVDKKATKLILENKSEAHCFGDVTQSLEKLKAQCVFHGNPFLVVVNRALEIVEQEKNAITLWK
ncbi:hypothetical protein ACYSNU_07360 [Enterococcus sp. LJL120]